MAVLGMLAFGVLELPESRETGLLGLILGGSAAPGLLIAGAPFADDAYFPAAIAASAPLWIVLGFVAARRATRVPVATWGDYTRELLWLSTAVVIGAAGALVTAAAVLGRSLIV